MGLPLMSMSICRVNKINRPSSSSNSSMSSVGYFLMKALT